MIGCSLVERVLYWEIEKFLRVGVMLLCFFVYILSKLVLFIYVRNVNN